MMALSCSMPSLFKNKSKDEKYKNALPIDLALFGAVPPDVQELAQSRQQLLWQLVQSWSSLIEEMFNEDVWEQNNNHVSIEKDRICHAPLFLQ